MCLKLMLRTAGASGTHSPPLHAEGARAPGGWEVPGAVMRDRIASGTGTGDLGRHELHRRALHGFGNRFGIIEVVLLSLAIGADIFGRHQPGIVTKRCEFAAQVMCADAGFHAD